MNNQRSKASLAYLALAALVLIVGLLSVFWIVLRTAISAQGAIRPFVMPGTYQVDLPEPGTYTIYYEYESVVGNQTYSTGKTLPTGLTCEVLSQSTGSQVEVVPASGAAYKMGSRSGVSVFQFTIDEPGPYEFSAAYSDGRTAPPIVLALEKGLLASLLTTVLAGFAICFGSLALAVTIVVVVLVKRYRTGETAPDSQRPVC